MSTKSFKIAVFGPGGVGKSALTIQFVRGIFVEKYDPTVDDSYRKQVDIDRTSVMLEITDTAGTDHFMVMRDLYMKNGQGFILVYSITSIATFTELDAFHDQILLVRENDKTPPPHIITVGNKCDLDAERQVLKIDGETKAKAWHTPFFETSAKTRVNVSELFYSLVRKIIQQSPKGQQSKCHIL